MIILDAKYYISKEGETGSWRYEIIMLKKNDGHKLIYELDQLQQGPT